MNRTLEDLKKHYLSVELDPAAEDRILNRLREERMAHRPRSRFRRKLAITAIIGAGFAGAGVGTAVATGALPRGVAWAFGDPVPGAYNAKLSTARLIMNTTGPDGPASLWYADTQDGGHCVEYLGSVPGTEAAAAFSGQPTAIDGPPPMIYAGGCGGGFDPDKFGIVDVAASGGDSPTAFVMRVPGASRVVLEVAGRTPVTLKVADGWTCGWYPSAKPMPKAVVVGYDAAGNVVGRKAITFPPA